MHPTFQPSHLSLQAYVALRASAVSVGHRLRSDQRGEGVISAAIAILVMAFLGAALWVTFKGVLTGAGTKTQGQIDQLGNP